MGKRVSRLILKKKEYRYILSGLWNTLFAYVFTIILFFTLADSLHTVLIGILATVINIAQSFFVHKIFVFRTKGNWLIEFYRCYVVYGVTSIVSIGLLWLFIDLMLISIFLAQALVMLLTFAITYLGHIKYTFKTNG